MPVKMDINSDDVFSIDVDPALLLSYELDKLNLDSIPNDIFEFSEEISKNYDNLEGGDIPSLDNKIVEAPDSKEEYISISAPAEDKSYVAELKLETQGKKQRKQDLNRNEELSSYGNLNQLFVKLELSDSDNENFSVKERGSEKRQSYARKNRDQINILNKKQNDKSQFNPQSLKFLSGSSKVEFYERNTTDQFNIYPNLNSVFSGNETVPTLTSQDYLCGDARAKAVASPESGYESSSAQSGSSSPPLLPLSATYNLDFIPETVDEQNILEFLVENTTDCALSNHHLSLCNSDSKDAKGKINEIINYLKDVPDELNESSNLVVSSDNIHKHVPLASQTQDIDTKSVPVSFNPIPKSVEIPKKIVYKLNDKAKKTLRDFLSDDEFYAAEKKIYKKINEDKANNKDVKVIYVEEETDRAPENRTNLHYAVLELKIEDVYCLVEIHKQYDKPFTDINIRDKYGKTALDYAIQNKMTLVIDYLKENNACQSVNI